ncbi:MAG: hypothetical protein FWC43_04670 [Planctomycetaceae bacterium]|nr:hypothetical protein [Planctomycetaceae bacterium]
MGVDLLDIVFRLEKAFSITIDRGDLVPGFILNDKQGMYTAGGKVTTQGLDEIRRQMPSADLSSFEKNPVIWQLASILTVRTLCDIVEQKIQEKNKGINGPPYSRAEIENGVAKALCEVLAIKPEEIKPEARIYQDLGAE